jgi:hypothetical protein
MEAWNHCLLSREQLRDALESADVTRRIATPEDNETIILA